MDDAKKLCLTSHYRGLVTKSVHISSGFNSTEDSCVYPWLRPSFLEDSVWKPPVNHTPQKRHGINAVSSKIIDLCTRSPFCASAVSYGQTRLKGIEYCLRQPSKSAEKELTPAETEIMAEHNEFQIRKADKDGKRSSNTLVVFFGFYGASERAIESYCEVYHRYGFDVVYVKSYLKQFAWPKNSQTLAAVLLNHIKTDLQHYQNILVHAMSMGAYNFTVVMGEFYDKPEVYRDVENKVRAVVYDSIVIGSLKNMSRGVGRGASKNPVIQRLIPLSMSAYLNATYPFTVRIFNHYIDQFKQKPLNVPTLLFYSKDDPMADYSVLSGLVKEWKGKFTFSLSEKCWDTSKHARHLQTHKDDYLSTLQNFLKAIPGLLNEKAKL